MLPESMGHCIGLYLIDPGIKIESFTKDEKKEKTAMKVSYKGFEGELLKMERKENIYRAGYCYELEIYDSKNGITHTVEYAEPKDIKFME